MKKMFSVLLCTLLIFSLIGCTGNAKSSSNENYISTEEATKIALNEAGLSKDDVSLLKATLKLKDEDYANDYYEVEFHRQLDSYEYKLDPTTGVIFDFSIDIENEEGVSTLPGNMISEEEAKNNASGYAKFSESEVTNFKIHFNNEDEDSTYDIYFETENGVYSFEVDAFSGTITEYSFKAYTK